MVHPVQMGKRTRMSFARIEEALAVPDLIEVQKNSYRNFLKEGASGSSRRRFPHHGLL